MNKLMFFGFFVMTSFGWAQSIVPTVSGNNPPNPNMREVEQRIHAKMLAIKSSVNAGSLTVDQATAQRTQLKSIRAEENTDLAQNGHMELTDDQKTKLDGEVDQVGVN
jgi:hypothetical protein